MRRGIGCSPLAVPAMLRFLRENGSNIACTAVLGPVPLIALARLIAKAAKQKGVEFFSEIEEAQAWRMQFRLQPEEEEVPA
mmetsp:Transcript_24146/g.68377  ORF Transcript_24146/g.68377 Transcript_24146/m.68377 type:complete len:81 (+) Transcript_24146:3-245(+)